MIKGVFRADLRVTSKLSALEFYKGVKGVILIPLTPSDKLRVEPNKHISIVSNRSLHNGMAPFIPSSYDEDGSIAYSHRKAINAYLKNM